MTNGQIVCDAREMSTALGGNRSLVINDFMAVGQALPVLPDDRAEDDRAELTGNGTKAALGPGTGLGMGFVAPEEGRWRVLPSEGGHANLAPTDPLEMEVLGLLIRRFDFVGWETVLCGPGLVNLYKRCARCGAPRPRSKNPAEITSRALSVADPVCHQTLEMFCNLLGTAAGRTRRNGVRNGRACTSPAAFCRGWASSSNTASFAVASKRADRCRTTSKRFRRDWCWSPSSG